MKKALSLFVVGLCLCAVTQAEEIHSHLKELAVDIVLHDSAIPADGIHKGISSEAEQLLERLHSLSPAERNVATRYVRQLSNSTYATMATQKEMETMALFEELFLKAEELVGDVYMGALSEHELDGLMKEAMSNFSPEKQERLRTAIDGSQEGAIVPEKASCALHSYPGVHAGASAAGSTYSASSVARTVNEAGEWPCDFEVRFNVHKSQVTGSTAAMRDLILDFGGAIISRTLSGKDRLLFGYWRTFLKFGFSSESRLKNESKIF